MLYKLNGNLINIMEVIAVECSPSKDASYPYLLTVKMKSGNSYGVKYATEEGRRRELFSIRDEANRAFRNMFPPSVTRDELRSIVKQEIQKSRTEIRTLKNLIEEVLHRGSEQEN